MNRHIPEYRNLRSVRCSVAGGGSPPLSSRHMQNNAAIAALGALALDTRLRAFRLLADAGADGLPAGEIARRLDVAQNTLSDHLQVLARAGIVSSERRSRSIIYRANTDAMLDLINFLSATVGARSALAEIDAR